MGEDVKAIAHIAVGWCVVFASVGLQSLWLTAAGVLMILTAIW